MRAVLIVCLLLFLLIFLVIIYYIDGYRYMTINSHDLYKLDQNYKYKKKIDNCIISLTTTPNRLNKIRQNLISLLDQSRGVSEIRLNIPYYSRKGEKYHIPKWLKSLKTVKIHRVEKDWGPSTKLIPSLLDPEYPKDKKIIVVDDDVIYGYYMVETLNNYFEKYNQKGKKTAITMYGDCIKKNCETENGFFQRAGAYICGEKYTDVLRGHSAYMVSKNMFKRSITDYSKLPPECIFVDDNYFSFHLKKNKIKILMVGMCCKGVPLPDMGNCFIDGLHPNHNGDGKNEKIVNKFFLKNKRK